MCLAPRDQVLDQLASFFGEAEMQRQASPHERVWQPSVLVRGYDYQGQLGRVRANGTVQAGSGEFTRAESFQQTVRHIGVGLVDLVDQNDHAVRGITAGRLQWRRAARSLRLAERVVPVEGPPDGPRLNEIAYV